MRKLRLALRTDPYPQVTAGRGPAGQRHRAAIVLRSRSTATISVASHMTVIGMAMMFVDRGVERGPEVEVAARAADGLAGDDPRLDYATRRDHGSGPPPQPVSTGEELEHPGRRQGVDRDRERELQRLRPDRRAGQHSLVYDHSSCGDDGQDGRGCGEIEAAATDVPRAAAVLTTSVPDQEQAPGPPRPGASSAGVNPAGKTLDLRVREYGGRYPGAILRVSRDIGVAPCL